VPVYPHEAATLERPPDRAVKQGGDASGWPVMDSSYEFLWPIYPMSLIEMTKRDGEVILGYHRSLDRSTGAISVSTVHSPETVIRSVGTRTLRNFRKLVVDRLGNVSEAVRETRTWRGGKAHSNPAHKGKAGKETTALQSDGNAATYHRDAGRGTA
jgi:CRISPR-associated endonuclease Csn1